MTIKLNEQAVHAQHGIGRVVKMETRRFGAGPEQDYYNFAIATGTVWVPVGGASGGLRELTPKGDLDQYRGLLKSRPAPLASDHRQRQNALAERLKDSSFGARCSLVRDLSALGWSRALNESSSATLRSARHAVCAEWAAVEGLSLEEATHEVTALLLEGRRAYEEKG